MGMNNRQRRAAKAKVRAHQRSTHRPQAPGGADDGWFSSHEFQAGAASLALRQVLLGLARVRHADDTQFLAHPPEYQQLAVDDHLTQGVSAALAGGWTPLDLREAAGRRSIPAPSVDVLLGVVAAQTAAFSRAAVDPRWLDQLGGAVPERSSRDRARAWGLGWPAARSVLIDLLVFVMTLPKIQPVMPRPGSFGGTAAAGTAADGGPATAVDQRMLRKVRGLLAKAEATDFAEEADALTAKAQQLMTAYSIEQAVAEAGAPVGATPSVRRVWLDAPYVDGKAALVDVVAASNRCRCVLTKEWGFVTLVGFVSDLDAVELLSMSLLVQATRAMAASGSHTTRHGVSCTRSFRQSFLFAYAQRIGERLSQAASATESAADADRGGALLPVLAARHDAVDDAVDNLFPELIRRPRAATNLAGYNAGRAAADLASLEIRDRLTGRQAG